MTVLVDTSVWIRFLANRAPYAAELDRLLTRRRSQYTVKRHLTNTFTKLDVASRTELVLWVMRSRPPLPTFPE